MTTLTQTMLRAYEAWLDARPLSEREQTEDQRAGRLLGTGPSRSESGWDALEHPETPSPVSPAQMVLRGVA